MELCSMPDRLTAKGRSSVIWNMCEQEVLLLLSNMVNADDIYLRRKDGINDLYFVTRIYSPAMIVDIIF